MIAQLTRRASGSYDGRRCSICRGIKQSLALYFSLAGNDHIDPNENVAQHASRKSITSYFNDEDDDSSSPSGGEEVGEGERDDEEHNSEEETLSLDSFFLPLNQNSLDKRVKLAVMSQLMASTPTANSDLFWTLHNPIEEPSPRI